MATARPAQATPAPGPEAPLTSVAGHPPTPRRHRPKPGRVAVYVVLVVTALAIPVAPGTTAPGQQSFNPLTVMQSYVSAQSQTGPFYFYGETSTPTVSRGDSS